MAKRGKIDIIHDILKIVNNFPRGIKFTPLLRKSNLSTLRFKEYYEEIKEKELVKEILTEEGKKIIINEKGILFLDKYSNIKKFIEEFGL